MANTCRRTDISTIRSGSLFNRAARLLNSTSEAERRDDLIESKKILLRKSKKEQFLNIGILGI